MVFVHLGLIDSAESQSNTGFELRNHEEIRARTHVFFIRARFSLFQRFFFRICLI